MASILGSESCSVSAASVDRQVLGRSIEWMRRIGQKGGYRWGLKGSLRNWDPWTNEIKAPPQRPQRIAQACHSPIVTTKSAGSIYDFLVSQEMQQIQQQLPGDATTTCSDLSSSSVTGVPIRPPRSNSNTNNKNPFSLAPRSDTGLRDVQRHKADGKQTTIITHFKAAESNQDGKVDINILMDSESNVSNALDDSSEDATVDSDVGDGSAARSSDADDSGTNSKSDPDGGGGGAGRGSGGSAARGGGSTSDDDQNGTPGSTSTRDPSEGEVLEAEEEGAAEGEGADDSEPADELPAPGDEKKSDKTEKKKLNMGHLDKEGIVIGCMNVFADVCKKEYIVLLTDKVVEAFLIDPGQFRSIAKRTGCEIEVTRRILNRRIGTFRWVKYLVVTLRGPNLVAIDQCDRLMVKAFPPYKIRKPYPEAAQIALFVKESYPDNSDLYFNFQRTGPTCCKVGDLRLKAPFGKSEFRPIETTPWKQTNRRLLNGVLEPRNQPMAISVQHVYPEWGTELCTFMDESCKWEQAGDLALDAEKKKSLERSLRVKERKLGAEPLFGGAD